MLHQFNRAVSACIIAALISAGGSYSMAAGNVRLPPEAVPTINKAVAYLEKEFDKGKNTPLVSGRLSLAAYALLKVNQTPAHRIVSTAVKHIEERQDPEKIYNPVSPHEGIYEAGVDLMLLAEVDPEKYLPLMQQMVNYLIEKQLGSGGWTYPGKSVGDTSMSQYAVLGFWAAQRSGIDVPLEVWNKAAQWHISTQRPDGGFAYHPGTTDGPERGASTHNLTNAAGGSILICRLNMYPDLPLPGAGSASKKKKKPKKFGVLESADENAGKTEKQIERAEIPGLLPAAKLEGAAKRAMGWAGSHFVLATPNVNKNYYYYTIERFGSLFNTKTIGRAEWYPVGLDQLKKKQLPDGSWATFTHPVNATSFAILFMARATGKILKLPDLGGGLLVGGRGLPDDLSGADTTGGKIKKRKVEGDLDKLLTDFEKLDLSALEDTQTAIVEKIQLGSKDELLGEMPRIRKLIEHPNGDIRRTAVWALGRSGDLRDAYLLIQRFEESDVGVLAEANNALCYLSRKLSGIGVPDDPLDGLDEKATQEQKNAAMAAWKKDALEKWTRWYLRVRPYDDRNDLFQLKFGRAGKK
jgi:hypothetical protein